MTATRQTPESEEQLLKRVIWPSHEPLAFLRRRRSGLLKWLKHTEEDDSA